MAQARKRSHTALFLFWAATAILFVCFACIRLYNIQSVPMFTDEAIYIRWSQIGSSDANWRFISLTDGKQPLFTWIMMLMLRVIPGDPLTVGRLVSVLSGSLAFFGIMAAAWELYASRRVVLFAALLYTVSPFTVMYDRLALYDSLVAALYIWNLYLAVILVKRVRLDAALLWGMGLAAGMLNKSSGFISLYLVPVTLLLFDGKDKTRRVSRFLRWVFYVGVAALLSQILYSVLRLSPFFHMIGLKNTVFVYPFSEWVTHPFRFLIGNLRGLFDWVIGYLTVPVFVMGMVSGFLAGKRWKENLMLYIFSYAPFFGLALFGKVLYPRFVLFMSMPILLLSALSLDFIYRKSGKFIIFAAAAVLLLLPGMRATYMVLTNPYEAPIPKSDTGQLLNDWPAGGGIRETVAYLASEGRKGEIAVFTDGTFGLLPYALEIYLVADPNIRIKGIWPLPAAVPDEVVRLARSVPTYLITNQMQETPAWPLTLLSSYPKGVNQDVRLRLYRVIPDGDPAP